jgi:hypothetical protein
VVNGEVAYDTERGDVVLEAGLSAVGYVRQQAPEGGRAAAPGGGVRDGAPGGGHPGAERGVVQQSGERARPGPHVAGRDERSAAPPVTSARTGMSLTADGTPAASASSAGSP